MAISKRAVYATQPNPLHTQIAKLLDEADGLAIEGEIQAIIVPDTNLLSGASVAADIFKALEGRNYETVILVAPSHEGSFRRLTICSVDEYHTPLGDVPVNDRVRHELCDEDDDIFLDDSGHYHTEGVDVQLPYLQSVLKSFSIVPVVMGEESPELCKELGTAVGEVMFNRKTLVVASADVLEASEDALERLKELFEEGDVSRLMQFLNGDKISVEGKGAILTAVIAAQRRRANHARVVSLEAPSNSSPGFLGAVIWR